MIRVGKVVASLSLLLAFAACGDDDTDSGSNSTSGGGGSDLAAADVTVAAGSFVDAEKDGGDELSDVSFADPADAVCTIGERIGVIPDSVDEDAVEVWTNATEKPVVFVYPEDVEGNTDGLPTCSVGYEEDEFDDTLLHGQHTHAAH